MVECTNGEEALWRETETGRPASHRRLLRSVLVVEAWLVVARGRGLWRLDEDERMANGGAGGREEAAARRGGEAMTAAAGRGWARGGKLLAVGRGGGGSEVSVVVVGDGRWLDFFRRERRRGRPRGGVDGGQPRGMLRQLGGGGNWVGSANIVRGWAGGGGTHGVSFFFFFL